VRYGVYFDKKLIGRMDDITQGLKDDNPEVYKGNQKIFNLSFLDSRGYTDAALDAFIQQGFYDIHAYWQKKLKKFKGIKIRRPEGRSS
jgi:hypothetical protein